MIHMDSDISKVDLQVCSRCIYDERVSGISFDSEGVCNYCRQQDELIEYYGTGTEKGEAKFDRIVEEIKRYGKNKKYDCVVGVSGGVDSSYMLHLAKERGLRPLAVHYDNTWNTAVSTQNIRKMLDALGVDLYTHVVDNKEADDIFRSFFLADVAEIEASTDLALAEVLYRASAQWGIKHALEGHSFIAEGITPLGRNYFDGKYIRSIHALYGQRPMKTYPLMTFSRFLWWAIARRVQRVRPYWYIKYSKEEAMQLLKEKYGWEYYGGHHLENRMTAFAHNIYFPRKFNTDFRNNTLAALARRGTLSRAEAWKMYNAPRSTEEGLVSYFCKRLGFSEDEFEAVMRRPGRSWMEFPTDKKRFERFRPLFAYLLKRGLVPHSFYLKYCFPSGAK